MPQSPSPLTAHSIMKARVSPCCAWVFAKTYCMECHPLDHQIQERDRLGGSFTSSGHSPAAAQGNISQSVQQAERAVAQFSMDLPIPAEQERRDAYGSAALSTH